MIFVYGVAISLSIMFFAWSIYLRTNNPGIIDVFWGINIAMVGSFYLLQSINLKVFIVSQFLLLAWSIRLSLYLFITRIKTQEVDQRYKKLSDNWKNQKRGFLYNFLFQGLLGFIIATPFYFIAQTEQITLVQYISYLIIVIGFIGEIISDFQLHNFKNHNIGKICDIGLWNYSRHPNYFFECLIWFGFSLIGLNSYISIASFISVITLFLIMWFLTIPMTEEQSLISRGDKYKDYQNKVSCFLPWFNNFN